MKLTVSVEARGEMQARNITEHLKIEAEMWTGKKFDVQTCTMVKGLTSETSTYEITAVSDD